MLCVVVCWIYNLTISVEGKVIAGRWWSRGCCRVVALDQGYQFVSVYVCVSAL